MSDNMFPSAPDRLVAILAEHETDITAVHEWRCICGQTIGPASAPEAWKTHVADALIAAGVAMPEPICGATAVICGCAFVCDEPNHGDDTDHMGSDSVGWMRWRDTDAGVAVTGAYSRDGWPIQ